VSVGRCVPPRALRSVAGVGVDGEVARAGWFPDRLIGGVALVLGPVAWGVGLALRAAAVDAAGFTPQQAARFAAEPFAAPAQLAAYAVEPGLVTAGYAVFLAGALLLWPAVVLLARLVAVRSPVLGGLGGALLVLGLFGRAYHAGVDQTAFALTGVLGLDTTTRAVMDTYVEISYGPWLLPVAAGAAQYPGTLLLAVGAYRSGLFGAGRSLALLWWGTLWVGVLKAGTWLDAGSAAALCLALVPLGVQVLRGTAGPPAGPRRRPLSW
jgi:hypothetical protein